ncbi:TylF/MycF/NovP-related O-methyltransferase [Inquilinus sp. CAU 1745]|uniref:TylF/MycF/NovP-related O-methyltransferase n=1 Tax=Inquilinus sp. CAU 1745 TaxID=3140369 RepID=UPI00325B6C3C
MTKKFLKFLRNSLSRREDRKLNALKTFGHWLFPNYRFSWPQLDWWDDPEFNEYLRKFEEPDGFNTHRKWMLLQLLRLTSCVPGDTAECGVFRGASSWLICAANRSNKNYARVHHLFDSFEGLSEPSVLDGAHWAKGNLAVGEDLVRRNLENFGNIQVHKGWIPERFANCENIRFSFVHIDVDLYEPTRDSIEFFYDRINQGGILLCDDYGFTTCPGATKAIDEFLEGKPEKMVALDAGSGFLIKGISTATKDIGIGQYL